MLATFKNKKSNRTNNLSNLEKLYILLQPYIKKKEIKSVLRCTAKKADEIFENILILMRQKNYRILDYNFIPTKLFVEYCQINIDDFVRNADIELKMTKAK